MSRQTLLWVIGAGTLGAAIGFQLGNLAAAPPPPSAGRPLAMAAAASDPHVQQTRQPTPGATSGKTIDVAELASALGDELGAARLREELAETLCQELRSELQALLGDELGRALARAGSAQAGAHATPPPSEEEREAQAQALADAQSTFEDVRARGRFDPQSRDEWMALLPSLDPDAQYELSRQLAVALNNREIEFDDPSELPLF